MKRHLTEKDIIEYQFKLGSEADAKEISTHLESCGECRAMAERLKRKFASLDVLQGDITVSEKLIAETVKAAKKPSPRKIIPFGKGAWMSAAAAIVVIGLMLLTTDLIREKDLDEFATKSDTSAPSALEGLGSRDLDKALVTPKTVRPDDPADIRAGGKLGADEFDIKKEIASARLNKAKPMRPVEKLVAVAGDIAEAPMPEKPPFAPASAIELVVLPQRDNVQITIYNSADLTLVREKRNLTLKKGWNWLQFSWANTLIDPTSLSLEPLRDADKIDIQQLVFPARLKDIGRWLIHSETEGQVPFEITYFTSGLSWRAFYAGTLDADEQKMKLVGYVRLSNASGEDYENAQTRLIVGKVHQLDKIAELAKRQYPYNRPGDRLGSRGIHASDGSSLKKVPLLGDMPFGGTIFYGDGLVKNCLLKEIKKEGLSEYFLYTIEGRETIPNKWGKRLMSFEADDVEVESLYKYDEERWGTATIRYVTFANDEEHELGQTPIPNGMVKIYAQAGDNGHLSYVGGTSIKYIPVDEEVELNLGPSRLVDIEPVLMDTMTENYTFDNNGNITGWDEVQTWKIKVTNTRQLAIETQITRGFGMPYWTLLLVGPASTAEDAVDYEKYDATHARFTTQLSPRSKKAFAYTLRKYHGKRQQQANR